MQFVKYRHGDSVLVKGETANKLSTVFDGPYKDKKMSRDYSPDVLVLKHNTETLMNKNRTKLYHM